MDQERARIQDDLRGLLQGSVHCDDVYRQMYAGDASIYELMPLGVVRPSTVADVQALVRYALDHDLSLHARGAGTGVAGESLGRGLIVDFAHSMRRILAVDEESVRVQPGVTLATLNRHLAAAGRMFGPDPATRSVTTIGSVLALDASGSHWLKYGSARSHVEHLQVVAGSGDVIEAREQDLRQGSLSNPGFAFCRDIAALVERHADALQENRPQSAVNRCGYHLYDICHGNQIDLHRLLVGSEGTLGLITEATLRTVPKPKYRGVSLLFFDRLDTAARAALEIAGAGVSACDLMDRRLLTIARETDVRYEMLIPGNAEAMLLIEAQADDLDEVRDTLAQILHKLKRRRKLLFDSRTTVEVDERNLYWRLARRVIPTLYRLKGSTRALPFVEDLAVPPHELPGFLVTVQNVLKSHHVTATIFAHAGHGQLHIRPFLDLHSPTDTKRIEPLARDLYDAVVAVKGTLTGEHGVGLSRTWFMQRHVGVLYPIFREVKQRFDPGQILNPGKVIADTPQSPSDNLRPPMLDDKSEQPQLEGSVATTTKGTLPQLQLLETEYHWSPGEIFQSARMCNGCGRCRTGAEEERMCPIYRLLPSEEASPRAKANLIRGVMTGSLDAKVVETEDFKRVADLCFNCHQCRLECPASVDIPHLMLEAKAQYARTNGFRPSDLAMARIDWVIGFAARFRSLTNWSLSNRWMRWLFAQTLGIAQGRKLPRIANRTFMRIASRMRLNRMTRFGDRKVALFVDTFANYFDPQLAECLVSILRHNGISVFVPQQQLSSGMPLIALGATAKAKKLAQHNVELLAEAIRQGYHVIAPEPAAALCLQHEYPHLLDDEDARLVAKNSSEACSYLWKMHQNGRLELDFQPVNLTIGYHLPCHVRAIDPNTPGQRLLQLIPGLSLKRIEKGCSGMAGTWGMKRENYRKSLRIGRGLISAMRSPSIAVGSTECSTCRVQMEQGTSKPTLHPLKILALAYRLHPEIQSLLERRGEDRVLTR